MLWSLRQRTVMPTEHSVTTYRDPFRFAVRSCGRSYYTLYKSLAMRAMSLKCLRYSDVTLARGRVGVPSLLLPLPLSLLIHICNLYTYYCCTGCISKRQGPETQDGSLVVVIVIVIVDEGDGKKRRRENRLFFTDLVPRFMRSTLNLSLYFAAWDHLENRRNPKKPNSIGRDLKHIIKYTRFPK
jgi:hypothetical protein